MSQSEALVRDVMRAFCARTGVTGEAPPRRYLWTDAFAACNLLGLHRGTGDGRWLDLALRLVDQVHHVLGRHRPDDERSGWISGLPEAEGELHPTRGGLRIGKRLPERPPDEPYDPRLEWERDGQYFHYLTQWMHALQRVALETGQTAFHDWAVELAVTAHRAFTYPTAEGRPKRMVWKASIDLTRPLVPSMGHHDPLDALVRYLELATDPWEPPAGRPELLEAVEDARAMCADRDWATDDALGIGGLLLAAARLAQLALRHRAAEAEALALDLLGDGERSLEAFLAGRPLDPPAERRLAFRELGLAIGWHGVERVATAADEEHPLAGRLRALERFRPLANRVESFWSEPRNRRAATWTEHEDINAVMLATALAPAGYLGDASPEPRRVPSV